MIDLLVGGMYGDEGKGKIASYMSLQDKPRYALRTGSVNAGHTIVYEGKKLGLRIVPAAFLNRSTKILLPPGCLIRLDVLFKEMEETGIRDRLGIDANTAVITEKEVEEEKQNAFLSKEVGSTVQGVGAAESKRILRKLALAKDYKELKDYICNVPLLVTEAMEKGEYAIAEGSQGHLLSLYHGHYPYVTSRNTSSSGILSEIGISPKHVGEITLVFKAFTTRVGGGPLEGELSEQEAEKLGYVEFGTVTGRRRRAAPLDLDMGREICRVNGATQIAITKLDYIFKDAHKKRRYSELSKEAQRWVENVEHRMKARVAFIGTGEEVFDIIDMRKEK
ncbi:MAG: adenylosuccinate synthetase [Candidatus Micrarchaeota archaeon]|nr:adenylosuccinate synthetase [Candidatus Micrarchaeota archaeon]MDE1824407.1 adenylosuccinate synthetase [Candidatus Micrarchaeota archaeon]MDE1849870.1 adenylosuccinate synthetase [Candidatus Micrarchaeota archaeon]